ncbi:MAG: lysophospholipid acyltransferase family protein [Candidatus Aenigmatarchaeota archaeon]
MASDYQERHERKLDRSDLLVNYLLAPPAWLTGTLYGLETDGMENVPEKGPALILSKHSHGLLDVPLLGIAIHNQPGNRGRNANYIMKSIPFFNYIMKKFGGIIIPTASDMKRDDPGYRDMIKHAREEMDGIFDDNIRFVYKHKNGELIVLYPEGKVVRPGMGKLKERFVRRTLEAQEEIGEIPLIPAGIEYGGWISDRVPKRPVRIRIGKPMTADAQTAQDNKKFHELMHEIGGEIGRLSGGLKYEF